MIRSLKALNISIKEIEGGLLIKDMKDLDAVEEKISINAFLATIKKILRGRYITTLMKENQFKCHSFADLKNNPDSNKFLVDIYKTFNDDAVKFGFLGRCNSLVTNEVLHKRNNDISEACSRCGENESLMHRLNGCKRSLGRFTERHNHISRIITKAIASSFRNVTVVENHTVYINNMPPLPDRSVNLKPDIWFRHGTDDSQEIILIEITCPYGMMTDVGTDRVSALAKARQTKIAKYANLITDCNTTFGIRTKLFVIVVSSLGCVPEATRNDLKSLLRKEKVSPLAKKLSFSAIKSSFLLFNAAPDLDPQSAHSNSNPTSSDDDLSTQPEFLEINRLFSTQPVALVDDSEASDEVETPSS